MLHCNLAVLLAERNLKITKVSSDTGISRTTLTSLANNRSQGIQFDTLNTLCIYLNVSPEQLITFVPYDFKFEVKPVESLRYGDCVDIQITVAEQKKRTSGIFKGLVDLKYFPDKRDVCDIDINVILPFSLDDEKSPDNLFISKLIKGLPTNIRIDLGIPLYELVIKEMKLECANPMSFGITWFENDLYVFE